MKPISDAKEREILAMREQGLSLQNIAKRTQVSKSTVHLVCRAADGVIKERIGRPLTAAERQKIFDMRAEKKTYYQIATELGVSVPCVWRIARKGAAAPSGRPPSAAVLKARIIDQAEKGVMVKDIAVNVGLTPAAVGAILRREGYQTRGWKKATPDNLAMIKECALKRMLPTEIARATKLPLDDVIRLLLELKNESAETAG